MNVTEYLRGQLDMKTQSTRSSIEEQASTQKLSMPGLLWVKTSARNRSECSACGCVPGQVLIVVKPILAGHHFLGLRQLREETIRRRQRCIKVVLTAERSTMLEDASKR